VKNRYDVIIVGAGPAGIFAAYELSALDPGLEILMLDQGNSIEERRCLIHERGSCARCNPCSIMSGWAGAGAFSDGKLSLATQVGGRITDYLPSEEAALEYINYTDNIYLKFGAGQTVYGLNSRRVEDLIYECSRYNIRLVPCPVRHLGTEQCREILRRMYIHLTAATKTEFFPRTTVEDILVKDGRAAGVTLTDKNGEKREIAAGVVIAAPGRGGAQWLTDQAKKLEIKTTNNEVDIGVRVEVPNSVMDHLTRELYEAKLVYYSDTFENKVRSFCMNPGGIVSEEKYDRDIAVVNGHSFADPKLKTGNTNFALLVSTSFTEPFNQPIEYGKYIAKCANMLTGDGVMIQRLGDLLKGRRTDYSRLKKSTTIPTLKCAVPGDLSFVLPQRYLTSIVETLRAFENIAPGIYSKNTLLYGVEVKFYSSKVKVSKNLETDIPGFYTIGDGAGITRGLMQASVTGVMAARDILRRK